ncbi:MAG: peptide-methionine (S)-S-oxide reductase MsrA [Rhizomicrobium sp.]|jgi:peptide-methionine (S)-S-oxide reductase
MRTKILSFCLLLAAAGVMPACADEAAKVIPAPTLDNPRAAGDPQTAVLAGGCYWGMQAVFEHVKGVQKVIAGFAGPRETGEQDDIISRGAVPAEAVEITFDPNQISYGQILQIYFSVAHDPTEIDKQGPDRGVRYRSNIFYEDGTQEKIANAYIAQLDAAAVYGAPIATRVDRFIAFERTTVPQQDFVLKNPTIPYVMIIDMPKIAHLRALFPGLYSDQWLTVSGS